MAIMFNYIPPMVCHVIVYKSQSLVIYILITSVITSCQLVLAKTSELWKTVPNKLMMKKNSFQVIFLVLFTQSIKEVNNVLSKLVNQRIMSLYFPVFSEGGRGITPKSV